MVSADYTLAGDVTLTFSATGVSPADISHYRDAALAAAKSVHDRLWSSGIITADLSDREKALAYYTWVCENCVYDETATDASLSHIAYNLFKNGISYTRYRRADIKFSRIFTKIYKDKHCYHIRYI